MLRKLLGAVGLMAFAVSALAYEVRTIYAPPPDGDLLEADGLQVVTVQVVREASDVPTACQLQVTASAQEFSSPPADAASPGEDFTPTTAVVQLTVGANDTVVEQTFDVPVLDDTLVEVTEFFTAVVTGVTPIECDSAAVFERLPHDRLELRSQGPVRIA